MTVVYSNLLLGRSKFVFYSGVGTGCIDNVDTLSRISSPGSIRYDSENWVSLTVYCLHTNKYGDSNVIITIRRHLLCPSIGYVEDV